MGGPVRQIALGLSGMLVWALTSTSLLVAQDVQVPRITIGAVTKYTGSPSPSESQRVQEFLSNLELQLASSFAKSSDLDYLDRSNLDALFRELHLSSSTFFDASTGSLHGLLGRLDFLVVAEASSSTSARVRVLDVETSAVKVATLCQPRTTIFGSASTDAPECVSQIVTQVAPFAKARFATNRDRLMKAAAAQRAVEEQRTKLAEELKKEEQKRAKEEAAAEQRRAEEQRAAEEERAAKDAAAAAQQAEIEKQIDEIRPHYEEVVARLSSQTKFWKQMSDELNQQGHSLRSQVQSLLSNTRIVARRCDDALVAGKPDILNNCLDELSRKLDQLEEYK
jgi:hypothetical protein